MGLITGLMGGGITSHITKAVKGRGRKSDDKPAYDYGGGAVSYRKGGKVRKTGLARLHKGERVLTKRQAKRWRGK